jgi:hypothetical protein
MTRTLQMACGWAVVLASTLALADQCEWVDEATAQRAATLIRGSHSVLEWCQPCGEQRPASSPIPVRSVEVATVENGQYREVSINGKAEDLAYVFIETETGSFRNVAKAAGCPCTGVSTEIRLGADGRVTPITAKPKTLAGTLVGVEEGEHARCILRTRQERVELRIGSDFHGRCRDALGDEVRVMYTDEPSADDESGDARVLHALDVVRRASRP